MGEMDAAIAEFLIESDENLGAVERDLVDLEGSPDDSILSSIFRAIHTIKGTCSFLGYSKLESLAHTGETLLSLVRDGELALTPELTSALLKMVDAIRQMLACIEEGGTDGEEEYQELKGVLTALQSGESITGKMDATQVEREQYDVPQSQEASVADSPEVASAATEEVEPDPSMDEAIAEFLIESDENLGQVERDLVDLEETPDESTLSSIFRAIHTIKGTCAFLGYLKLESLAHTGETLLSLIRDGALVLTPPRTSALLTMVDAIRQMLASIETHKNDGTDDYPALKAQLTALQKDGVESSVAPVPPPSTSDNPMPSSFDESSSTPEVIQADHSATTEVSVPALPETGGGSAKHDPKSAPGDARGPSAADS